MINKVKNIVFGMFGEKEEVFIEPILSEDDMFGDQSSYHPDIMSMKLKEKVVDGIFRSTIKELSISELGLLLEFIKLEIENRS